MIGFHNIYSVLSWFGVLGFIAFTTYSVSCWFRMLASECFVPGAWSLVLCSRCLVSGAWFQVLGSGCLVPCAWFRLTEYKVIFYEKFVFNSLKRCYLWVFFLHFVFSLLFASFNFTKLQFNLFSSLIFFIVTVGLSLMIGFHNIYCVLSWFGVFGFIAFTTYSVSF